MAFIYRKFSRTELEKETDILFVLAGRVTEMNGELGGGKVEMTSSGKAYQVEVLLSRNSSDS